MTTERADAVFGALADATRRDILERAIARELSVSELATNYPMSFAAVRKHVAVLERAGLVRKRVAGRRRLVLTDVEGLHAARRLLDAYESLWRGRLERVHDLVEQSRDESPSGPDAPEGQERP